MPRDGVRKVDSHVMTYDEVPRSYDSYESRCSRLYDVVCMYHAHDLYESQRSTKLLTAGCRAAQATTIRESRVESDVDQSMSDRRGLIS